MPSASGCMAKAIKARSRRMRLWRIFLLRFQVLGDAEPRPVELVFGNEQDLVLVSRWRAPAVVASRPGVRDTLEFARLASKRWRYYRRSIATAINIANFKSLVAQEPQAEI